MQQFRQISRTLLVVAVLATSAVPAQAGFGAMLKQKAMKAVKGDKKAAAQNGDTGPVTKSGMTPEVTAARLDQFKKGMQVEVAERERVTKLFASMKSNEEYQKCSQQVAGSEDFQKILMNLGKVGEHPTQEEMAKATTKMQEDMAALTEKKCGPDPGKYSKPQMIGDAIGKGSDAAGLGDDMAYAGWKEWVQIFCEYVAEVEKQGADGKEQIEKMKREGIRIMSTASNKNAKFYYVYTADEVKLLLECCPDLLPLIKATV